MPTPTLTRRHFIESSCLLAGAALWHPFVTYTMPPNRSIITVNGAIEPTQLGITLPHEHILVDFIGAGQVSKDRYKADEVYKVALPYLRQLRQLGCRALVECTPAYLGRDVVLLQQLAKASGLQILTNTGYYGAVDGKFLPPHAYTESAEQLAERWLKEWREGIDGTDIRPGFIKISVDKAPLKDYNQKIVKAAALTHLQSGLTIAAHTDDGAAALEEIKILRDQGVSGEAFIWVHAQNEKDPKIHFLAAQQGAWIEFDGLDSENYEEYVSVLHTMKQAGYLNRMLVSHDAGWYHVGEPQGGQFRPYDTLFTRLLPALRKAGFTQEELDQLVITNPREAFTIKVRKAG